ncbi:hypothetical protein LLEC1_03220 [Akanthomyces lecanii]|uniref:Transcription factor IIIC 90kDa subunit N-terminal domain-containing protein n=1 Tax=Cordyceps confragosa TaxID=2714763 RepID=A0A179I329_CORDF|nr:hypothetical protein LLEC1_03220 [Akanthomyces lecanii]
MDRSKAPPLQSLSLPSRPLTSHAIAWSCDAELAIATIEGIHIFLPEYPRSGGDGEKPAAERYAASPQFPLFMHTSGSLRPDPAINAQLCLGKITGAGASLGQIIRVEWSPSGLGSNLRPVLTALTGHGAITCLGEYIDLQKPQVSTKQVRSFKNWRILWGLGAQLPLPIVGATRRAELGADVQIMNERITAFSWAKEILPGRALLAYETDDKYVAIMAVQFYSRASAPDEKGWDIHEIARFDSSGPHVVADELDPDFVVSGSAFSLNWSPWVTYEGKKVAVLSYVANNHVGFRRVVIEGAWKQGETPPVKVDEHDMKGICLSLSADAFLEWENTVSSPKDNDCKNIHSHAAESFNNDGVVSMRGIVASPFVLHSFQIPVTGPLSAAIPYHRTSLCSTTYPNEDLPTNPITGLVIHHADPSSPSPVPHYSLVRQSCTATNQDWFQTTLPEDETPLPQWAEDIGQQTVRRISLARALQGKDIDSDDSEDGDMDLEQDFGIEKLESEGPGGAGAMSEDDDVLPRIHCVFCDTRVWENGAEAICDKGHSFGMFWLCYSSFLLRRKGHLQGLYRSVANVFAATCASSGLPIMAPGISRVCAVCGLRCLQTAELAKLAREHLGQDVPLDLSAEICGGCGGKFIV